MSPQEYCTARIVGQPGYYAALFAPTGARAALQALFAIHAELEAIPAECSDPTVARAKYQWWLEDIAQARAGAAQHPAVRALEASDTGPQVPTELLAELLHTFATPLTASTPDLPSGAAAHWHAAGATLGRLLARAGGEGRPAALQVAADVGAQIRVSEMTLRGQIGGTNPRAPEQIESAHAGLRDARDQAYALKAPTLTPHLVLAELRLAQLRQMGKASPARPAPLPELHPLKMLWIAWRTARR